MSLAPALRVHVVKVSQHAFDDIVSAAQMTPLARRSPTSLVQPQAGSAGQRTASMAWLARTTATLDRSHELRGTGAGGCGREAPMRTGILYNYRIDNFGKHLRGEIE